jgi:hypothetical protein
MDLAATGQPDGPVAKIYGCFFLAVRATTWIA